MISIRASRPDEAGRAIDIWRAAVDATHDFLAPADRAALDALVVAVLPQVPLSLAVDADDGAVGFIMMVGSHVEALFVHPDHHGRGVGRALIEHAQADHAVITADVNEQNRRARAFYERLGFVTTGRSPLDAQGRNYPVIHLRRAPAPAPAARRSALIP